MIKLMFIGVLAFYLQASPSCTGVNPNDPHPGNWTASDDAAIKAYRAAQDAPKNGANQQKTNRR